MCLCCCACGGGGSRPATTTVPPPAGGTAPTPPADPAFGLTEDNAQLLLDPAAPATLPWASAAAPFQLARRELTALRPTYLRLFLDWQALQPQAGRAADLAGPVSGCARTVGPCGPYPGLAGELAAIASRQRARRAAGQAGPEVLIDVVGAPRWAASAPSGCELQGAPAGARAVTPSAIGAYRQLIAGVLSLARSEGAEVRWWSPWNEPNDGLFLTPQRALCRPSSAPLSAAVYAQLARALASVLRRYAPQDSVVLGELNGQAPDSAHSTSVASFVAALPADVLCLGPVWSLHAYSPYGPGGGGGEPVAALERALARRGGCAADPPLWITETGAGAPHPGAPLTGSPVRELEACRALAADLQGWFSDSRVGAVFQYTFRDDPAYPVGLVSADLARVHPSYRLWLALTGETAGRDRLAPAPSFCGG